MITAVNWCMRSYPAICTDHDNSMHIVISVSALALTAIASLTAMFSFHNRFEEICINRVSKLWGHKSGSLGMLDFVYSEDSKQFLRDHPHLKPIGGIRA